MNFMTAPYQSNGLCPRRDWFDVSWGEFRTIFASGNYCRCLVVLGMFIASLASAQEALRNSMAGDAAAQARRLQPESLPYTVKSGDFRLLATPSMGFQWNDNIRLSRNDQQEDVIVTPAMGFLASYPVTQRNLLQLNVTAGYNEYIRHNDLSTWYLQSGSELSFDVFVKDFLINFHDRFSYSQDAAQEAAVANTGSYGTFQNSAGLSTTWDLEDVVLTLGYDHQNVVSTAQQFDSQDHASEMVVARAGLKLNPRLTTGVEGTTSITEYNQRQLNNNVNYSIGAYADWQPGATLHVQPRAGYTITHFDQTSQSGSDWQPVGLIQPVRTSDLDSWYADLTASQQVTEAVGYSVSAGHEIRLGIESDAIEDWYFRPAINWSIVRDLSLGTSFFYEHGKQGEGNISGNFQETYDWYGGALNLSYPLMKKLTVSLNYRLTLRSSDVADREYAQNVVGLLFSYQLQ
jgi:hypothetical protein